MKLTILLHCFICLAWACCIFGCNPSAGKGNRVITLSGLLYTTPAVYSIGTPIPENKPTFSQGVPTGFSISPALPLGLSLNPTTGTISGTPNPNVEKTMVRYTVTASNGVSQTSASLEITIVGLQKFCVTYPRDNMVILTDPSNPDIKTKVITGQEPVSAAYGNVNGKPYFAVANRKSGNVTIIDGLTSQVVKTVENVGTEPWEIIYGNGRFFVTNDGSQDITIIDGTTLEIAATISLGYGYFQGSCYGTSYGKKYLMACLPQVDAVALINAETNTLAGVYAVEQYPISIANGNNFFAIAHQRSGSIYFVEFPNDIFSMTRNPIYLEGPIESIAYGSRKFAACIPSQDRVVLFDTDLWNTTADLKIGIYPCEIVYGNGRFAITCLLSNTIALVNSNTSKLISTENVSNSPRRICFGNQWFLVGHDTESQLIYMDSRSERSNAPVSGIAGNYSGRMAFSKEDKSFIFLNYNNRHIVYIDATNDSIEESLQVSGQPVFTANGNNHHLAITNGYAKNVDIIDQDRKIVKTIPVGEYAAAVAYGNDKFVVCNQDSHNATIIDANSYEVLKTVATGLTPFSIAYGNRVFAIINYASNTVTVIDSDSLEVTKVIIVGSVPTDITYGDDKFAVVNSGDETVSIIDAVQLETVAIVDIDTVESTRNSIAYGNFIFAVVNQKSDTVSLINSKTYEVTTLQTGKAPAAVAYGDNRFVIANKDTRTLSIVDSYTRQVIKTVPVGGWDPRLVQYGNHRFVVWFTDGIMIMDSIYDSVMTNFKNDNYLFYNSYDIGYSEN